MLLGIVGVAILGIVALPPIIRGAIAASHCARIALAVALIAPAGVLMGMPLPAGIRLMAASHAALVPWAWGMNGALSVIGATLAVFIAMNWGFSVTLITGAADLPDRRAAPDERLRAEEAYLYSRAVLPIQGRER